MRFMDKSLCLDDVVRVKHKVVNPHRGFVLVFRFLVQVLLKTQERETFSYDAPPAGKGRRNIYT